MLSQLTLQKELLSEDELVTEMKANVNLGGSASYKKALQYMEMLVNNSSQGKLTFNTLILKKKIYIDYWLGFCFISMEVSVRLYTMHSICSRK